MPVTSELVFEDFAVIEKKSEFFRNNVFLRIVDLVVLSKTKR